MKYEELTRATAITNPPRDMDICIFIICNLALKYLYIIISMNTRDIANT